MGKIAFSVGTVCFSWFGLILASSILVACIVNWYHVRRYDEKIDTLLNLTLLSIPMGIFFARVYYVAVNWNLYTDNPSEILQIWHGGLAIHGAFIGIIMTIWIYSRINKISFWRWADIVTPGLVLGQAIGQWGNFINQDAFGYPTEAPWGIYIDYWYRPPGYEQFDFFHPTFLYESGWSLLIFFIIIMTSWIIGKRKNKPVSGGLFLLYIILYSAGRLVIEGLRLDSEMLGIWRLAQVVSTITIFLSAMIWCWRIKSLQKL
ncbi:prolipoprotein diacylglyceryl transferase [Sporomusa aerivorans]|uniref:prolipoprotein diacylglyceryl transferase n=1 Tax=Sporomusa aerivorans TaxID=204936 RepID=UPI00352A7AB3